MTQDENCVISLISFFVFHLLHRRLISQQLLHCKKYFFFCQFSSFMQNLQQIAEMHRCDSNRVWRRRGKKKTQRLTVSRAKLKRRQRQITSVTDWRLKALKRDQLLHESREPPTHTIFWLPPPYTHNHFSLSSSSSTHLINTDTLWKPPHPPVDDHSFFFFPTIPARFQFRAAAAAAQQTATSVQFNVSESLIHW